METLRAVFAKVRRVLRSDGTPWLILVFIGIPGSAFRVLLAHHPHDKGFSGTKCNAVRKLGETNGSAGVE